MASAQMAIEALVQRVHGRLLDAHVGRVRGHPEVFRPRAAGSSSRSSSRKCSPRSLPSGRRCSSARPPPTPGVRGSSPRARRAARRAARRRRSARRSHGRRPSRCTAPCWRPRRRSDPHHARPGSAGGRRRLNSGARSTRPACRPRPAPSGRTRSGGVSTCVRMTWISRAIINVSPGEGKAGPRSPRSARRRTRGRCPGIAARPLRATDRRGAPGPGPHPARSRSRSTRRRPGTFLNIQL